MLDHHESETSSRPDQPYFFGTETGVKPPEELSAAERQAHIQDLEAKLAVTRQELEEIIDSPNSLASVHKLRHDIDDFEGRLKVLGVDPDLPSPEVVAEARRAAGLDAAAEDPGYIFDPDAEVEQD